MAHQRRPAVAATIAYSHTLAAGQLGFAVLGAFVAVVLTAAFVLLERRDA